MRNGRTVYLPQIYFKRFGYEGEMISRIGTMA